jgi:hypothetical protein
MRSERTMGDSARTASSLAWKPLLVVALLVRGGCLLAQTPGAIRATIPAMGVNVKDYGASGSEAQTTGRIVGGERVVEVADTSSFQTGQGIYLWLDLPEDGLVLADARGPDLTLQCDVSFGAARPGYADHHGGVVFRARDRENFWIVYFQGFPACAYQLGLKKMVEGKLQDAGPLIAHPELPAGFHLKVVTAGPAISVFVDDKQLGKTIEYALPLAMQPLPTACSFWPECVALTAHRECAGAAPPRSSRASLPSGGLPNIWLTRGCCSRSWRFGRA